MDINKVYGDLNTYSPQKLAENARAQQSQQAAAKQTEAAEQQSGDKVALSPEARLLGASLSTASAAPDIRADKVRELKEQVQAGTYKPNIKKAAANLIRDDMHLLK